MRGDGFIRVRWRGLCLACGLSLVAAPEWSVAQTVDDVYRAWEARQQRAENLRVTWTAERLEAKGSAPPHPLAKGGAPPRDMVLKMRHEFTVSGEKYRYVLDGPRWISDKQRYFDLHDVHTCDREEERGYSPDSGAYDGPSGSIGPATSDPKRDMVMMDPFIPYTFRGVNLRFCKFDLREAKVIDRAARLGDQTCVVLCRELEQPIVETCWVVPAHDYLIARFELHVSGKLKRLIAASHRRDPALGWIPAGWKLTDYGGEKVMTSDTCEVTSCSFSPAIAPDEFRVRFPAGTRVQTPTGTHTLQEGEPEPILNVTEEEARDLAMGRTPPSWAARYRFWRWATIAGTVAGALGVIVFGRRLMVRRRGASPASQQ